MSTGRRVSRFLSITLYLTDLDSSPLVGAVCSMTATALALYALRPSQPKLRARRAARAMPGAWPEAPRKVSYFSVLPHYRYPCTRLHHSPPPLLTCRILFSSPFPFNHSVHTLHMSTRFFSDMCVYRPSPSTLTPTRSTTLNRGLLPRFTSTRR